MWCEWILHSNKNYFHLCLFFVFFFNFDFWIQKFPNYNVSRIENFKIQTTCYFEYFLEHRIWEIVPDCIKKVTALRILNWKKNYGIQKTDHVGYVPVKFLPKVVFYNMPVIFLCSIFYHFYVTFWFCSWINFKSVLSFIVIFFNSVGKNYAYLQELVLA